MTTIGLVGSGTQLRTVARSLAENNHDLLHWCPEHLNSGEPIDGARRVEREAFAEVYLLIFEAPSHQARTVARELGDALTGRHVIVHLCRAIEAGTFTTFDQVLAAETPTRRVGFLTGPVAHDQGQPQGTAMVCASRFGEVHDFVEECLVSSRTRLYRSDDPLGAQLASVYARMLAIIFGTAKHMGVGPALEAVLFARGLAEIARFVEWRGGLARTVFGLAGAGNLYADIQGQGSGDFQLGLRAAEMSSFDADSLIAGSDSSARELIEVIEAIAVGAIESGVELFLLGAIHGLMSGEMSNDEALELLMTLPVLRD